jgi:hypothetical protein
MKRMLSAFLLSAALLVSVASVKADDDHHRYRRYYDRDGRDYHVYNREEDRAYRSYLREQRYEYRSLARQRRERQREYLEMAPPAPQSRCRVPPVVKSYARSHGTVLILKTLSV